MNITFISHSWWWIALYILFKYIYSTVVMTHNNRFVGMVMGIHVSLANAVSGYLGIPLPQNPKEISVRSGSGG
jgi:hypothetical protein